MIITDIIKAMQAGQEITNPETWKNAQTTTNSVAAILSIGITLLRLKGVDLHLTDDSLITMAGGVAAILGVVNGIITTISSKKVGIKPPVS
jgi:hypothetical protein